MAMRVQSSMSALRLDVERCSNLLPNCGHTRTHMVCLSFDYLFWFWLPLFLIYNICYEGCVSFLILILCCNPSWNSVKLDTLEAFCSEPGCMKYFTNEQCLKEHVRSCHQHVVCEICGKEQLKKNMKRHLRMHEAPVLSERVKCSYEGCPCTYSKVRSNFSYSSAQNNRWGDIF